MSPPEQFVMTNLDRARCWHGDPVSSEVRPKSAGCFVERCAEPVEWAGWWYRSGGARHLTESCGEHSDHDDFTPVTRFAAGAARVVPGPRPTAQEAIVSRTSTGA
jgi:hypothetical protein